MLPRSNVGTVFGLLKRSLGIPAGIWRKRRKRRTRTRRTKRFSLQDSLSLSPHDGSFENLNLQLQ